MEEKKKQLQLKKAKALSTKDKLTEFLLYTAPNGDVKVEIFVHNETVWLNQERMAELFGVQRPAITKHLKNIFESGELVENVVSSILEHTTLHGAIEGRICQQITDIFAECSIDYYRTVDSRGKRGRPHSFPKFLFDGHLTMAGL